MNTHRKASVIVPRPTLRRLIAPALIVAAGLAPHLASAQGVVACDFDIADDMGQLTYGNTVHLEGRRGTASNTGTFFIINGNTPEGDVDHDGYSTSCTYNNLFIASRTNLVNTANPSLAIPGENIVVTNLPRSLPSGTQGETRVSVQVPQGTAAGTYIGQIEIRDNVIFAALTPTRDLLNVDVINVEVHVTEDLGFAILNADSAAPLDSLVLRGRAGERTSAALRLANTGNAGLSDVQVSATDLRSESAVGLFIPAANVTVSPSSLASIQMGDTTRLVVTVQIPRGLLGGRYRGTLRVQSSGTAPEQIPIVVIVTSTRGILFGNNPVREINGDIANIAFNGDPGTQWRLAIYDMAGLVTYKTSGTVFPGSTPVGGGPLVGADFAVNVIWPLQNGRGEGVASGMYLVVVESIVEGKRQLAQDKLMVIR
jgi:hypothetical protein